jgi:hypothetical protein
VISAGPDADSDTLLSGSLGFGSSVSGDRPLGEGLVAENNLGAGIAGEHWVATGKTDGRKIEALIATEELRDANGLIDLLELRTSLESAPRVIVWDLVS